MRGSCLLLFPLVAFSNVSANMPSLPSVEVRVTTSFGELVGEEAMTVDEHWPGFCERWLGIPYAKPPIGSLRFANPQSWDAKYPARGYHAKKHPSMCPQGNGTTLAGTEDCLFLNIWRPRTPESKALPVMVFIHGGGFVTGASDNPTPGKLPPWLVNSYDGCEMSSRQQVIVATMNYRIGHIGFAAFKSESGITANFGLSDQQEALRWLQREVHAFGGDAGKVTIFGESAGGDSVWLQLASPLSKGLYRAAIVESGMWNVGTTSAGIEQTTQWANRVGCSDMARLRDCLLNKTLSELAAVDTDLAWNPYASFPWGPVIDGVHFDSHPAVLYNEGRINHVPILGGANTDEGTLFVYTYYNKSMSEATYKHFVQGLLNQFNSTVMLSTAELARLYELYPSSSGDSDNRAVAAQMLTDATFTCSTQQIAKDVTAVGQVPFFLFRFDHRSGCFDTFLKNVPGVFHSSELDYVFYTPLSQFCLWSKEERQLSSRMQSMWANFAKNLVPVSQSDQRSSDSVQFPPYDPIAKKDLVLRVPADTVEEDYRGEHCRFWNEVVYARLGEPSMLIV